MKRNVLFASICACALAMPPSGLSDTPSVLLDYVESNGTQYIDTGVVGADGIRMEAEMEWTAKPSSASVFCGAASGTGKYFTLYTSAGSHQMGYDSWSAAQIQDGSKATADTRFRVESFLEAGSQFLNVRKLDGSGYTGIRTYNTAASVNTGTNLYIFARNDAGTAALFSSARLYFLKLWKKNGNGDYELVRHYIPCLDNGAAALYDKVGDDIYSPLGGALVAGPVLPRHAALVKWVQSDGSRGLYIDTGIPAKAGTGMTAEILWPVKPSAASTVCGAMADSTNHFTLYTSAGTHQIGYAKYSAFQVNTGTSVVYAGKRYRVSSSLAANAQNLQVEDLDGTGYNGSRSFNDANSIDTAQPLYLFARNDAGTPNQMSSARLYSLVLTNNLGVVRDFTPCVADNGKAGLYDDVSGRVFFPKAAVSGATAEFDLGTEVGPATNITASTSWPQTRPEWIEANGTNDYVDLGIIARDGTRMVAEMEWNVLPAAGTFCGAATNDARGLFTTYRITTGESSNFHRMGYYNGSSTLGGAHCAPIAGVRYRVETSLTDGEQVLTVAKQENGAWAPVGNGTRTVNLSFPAGYADLGLPLYLFARNFNGVADEFAPARLYSFKLWQNGTLVRDLCPAFDPADNAPCLFDKVSGRYFRDDGGYRLTAGGETSSFPGQTTVIIMR